MKTIIWTCLLLTLVESGYIKDILGKVQNDFHSVHDKIHDSMANIRNEALKIHDNIVNKITSHKKVTDDKNNSEFKNNCDDPDANKFFTKTITNDFENQNESHESTGNHETQVVSATEIYKQNTANNKKLETSTSRLFIFPEPTDGTEKVKVAYPKFNNTLSKISLKNDTAKDERSGAGNVTVVAPNEHCPEGLVKAADGSCLKPVELNMDERKNTRSNFDAGCAPGYDRAWDGTCQEVIEV